MANAGKILIMPKGDYNSNTTYEMLDLVKHNGTSWLAKKTVTGIAPSTAKSEYWQDVFDVASYPTTSEVESMIDRVEDKLTSDWTMLTIAEGFEAYTEKSTPRYKKVGDVVYFRGAVKPIVDIEAGTQAIFTGLPEECRPKDMNAVFVCQGSGINRWLLNVREVSGYAVVERYGTSENIAIPAGSWLAFDVCFSV